MDTFAGRPLIGVRVLVVDDNDDSRDLFRQILNYAGAYVVTASGAREALPLVLGVDVVVTDFSMPGEDGLWLLKQIEMSGGHRVPVIVVTGYADVYGQELFKAGFARVLRKPVDPWHLCAIITALAHTT